MTVVSPMILDSSGNVLRRIDPVDESLDLQLEPLSSAEIELKPGDTIPERSWVSVYTEHGLAGIFRSRPQRDRYGERSSRVSLVHGACELNDYLTTKGGDQEQDPANTAIAYIMQFYLGTHWRLGTVSATSSVVYQLNGYGVLDAIMEIMEQLPGYMLVFDQSVTPWTLNVLPRPETVSAEGRLSRNISSVEISRDDSSLCTRVYYGENDLFVEDAAAIQKYGVIEYRINDSGLTNAQLAAIAQAYLDNHKASKLSVSISAIDFYNATGEPLDRITLGSKYRLAIPDAETEENRVIEAIICSIRYDSVFSNNPQITLASDPDTIITFLKKQRRSGGSARQIAKEEAQKQYEHFVEETVAYRKEIYRVNGVEYDEKGRVKYVQATDSQGNPIWETDEQGHYIYDEDGNKIPVYAVDNAGNKIPVYNPNSNGSISGQIIQSAQRMATIIKQSGTVTEVFDKTKDYVIGDCVLYPDANGNPYRFTKDHDAKTDWKGTGENGDVEALGTLQSQIDQNVDYTASIYGTVTDLGGDVRQIKGSTIWQNETAIANIIGTVEIDKDGNLKIKDGKGLYVTGDSTINGFIKDNQMTAGYLIKKINGDETEAAVKADKIYLDADKTVKVGEALFITTGGAFWVKRNATFGNRAGEFVTINGGTVNAPTIQVNSGGSLQFSPGSQSGTAISINHTTAASLITDVHIKGPSENDNYYTLEYKKIGTGAYTWNPTTVKIPVSATSGLTDANVTNNILTLTKSDGSTVNFSKATSVTGEWGSRATPESSPAPNGTLYVKATQTNRNTTTGQDETTTVGSMDIHLHNAGHWGSASTSGEDVNTYYYRVIASQGISATMSETGLSFNVDASGRYTAGQQSISYSLTSATTTETTTPLSQGVYGLYRTVDGTAEQTPIAYYEVSGGTGASGTITDIILRGDKVTYNSTSEMIKVLLRTTGTDISNAPFDDYVELSVSASAVALSKGNLTNTSTDSFDNVYAGRYYISRSSGGLFKVENVNTITASVSSLAINLELAVPTSTLTTSGLTNWDSTDHVYKYDLTASLSVDSTGNTLKRQVKELTLNPTDAINYGKTLVTIDTITLGTITANSSARTATVRTTVTLDNGETKTADVDVSTIYQAGLDGGPAISSAPFIARLVDNDNVFIRNRQKTVNVSAIYQKGVDDATPSTYYVYVYSSTNTGRCAWYGQRSGGSRQHWIPHNAKVILLDASIQSSGRTHVGYYDDSRNYVTGYITSTLLHTSAKSGYSSPTYGWADDGGGGGDDPTPGVVIKGVYSGGYSGAGRVAIQYSNGSVEYFNVYATAAQVNALSYNQGTVESTAKNAFADTRSSGYINLIGRICYAVYSDGTYSPGMVIADPDEE